MITALSIIGSKGISLLIQLISIPLTYNYLGEERFGLAMTVLSFTMLLTFSDMGLGLGLMNKVAEYDIAENKESLKKAISSTFFLLTFIATFLAISSYFVLLFADWAAVFKITNDATIAEADLSILIFALSFIISLPFSIIIKLQAGFQEGYYNNLWDVGGNLLSLILLILFVNMKKGVPSIIFALYGAKSLSIVCNFIYHFVFVRREFLPSIKDFDFEVCKSLGRDGLQHFAIQLMTILIINTDTIIIAHYKGAESVAAYAIGYRLVSILYLPIMAIIGPAWPAYNDAFAQNDLDWIRRTLKKYFHLVIGYSTIAFVLFLLFCNPIIRLWINQHVQLNFSLVLVFGMYIIYFCFHIFFSTILNTPVYIKQFIKVYSLSAILVLIAKLFVANNFTEIYPILLCTIIGGFILYFLPAFRILNKSKTLVYNG